MTAGFAEASAAFLDIAAPDGETLERLRARYCRALNDLVGNRDLRRLLRSMQVHRVRAPLRLARPSRRADHRAAGAAAPAGMPDRAKAAARRDVWRLIADRPNLPDSAFATPA